MKNWYQVLQVSRQASDEEIKAAYRKLAKQYHPDAHPGDKECERRFQEISEAYSVLSDPEKRREYDGECNRTKQNFESFFGFHPKTKDSVNEDKLKAKTGNPLDASDIFEKFMGIKR